MLFWTHVYVWHMSASFYIYIFYALCSVNDMCKMIIVSCYHEHICVCMTLVSIFLHLHLVCIVLCECHVFDDYRVMLLWTRMCMYDTCMYLSTSTSRLHCVVCLYICKMIIVSSYFEHICVCITHVCIHLHLHLVCIVPCVCTYVKWLLEVSKWVRMCM